MNAQPSTGRLRHSCCGPLARIARSWGNAARRRLAYPGYVVLVVLSTALPAQDFSLDWWTVDGGGEVLAETGDQQWQLSGTLGQWDGTESQALSGDGWTLSGGFWPATVEETGQIFADGFEG